jgi:hypothetical protein
VKLLNSLLFLANLALFGLAAYFIFSRGYVPGAGWTPVELVTTVLTALAVLIGVLGIFIAALAVWGYTQLKDEARNTAAEAAREHLGVTVPKLVASEIERRIGTRTEYGEAAIESGDGNAGKGS